MVIGIEATAMTDEERWQLRAWEIVAEFARFVGLPSFLETADCASEVFLALLQLHRGQERVTPGLEARRGSDRLRNYIRDESRRQHEPLPEE